LVAFGAILSGLAACGGSGSGDSQTASPIQSIQISPVNPEAATGQTVQLTAMATYSDGTHGDVTGQVSWSSSNSAVATSGANGQVVAMAAGFAVIHASVSGVNVATQLTVTGSGGGLPPGYAYVLSADDLGRDVPGVVYQYAIKSDGSLAPLSIASVSTGAGPTSIVADPSGQFVYVANSRDATISQYAVGATGSLTALSPAVVSVAGPFSVAAGLALSADPRGRFLYIAVSPQDPPGPVASVAQYAIGSDGTLTPLDPAFINVPSTVVGPLAIDPTGQYAYAAGWSNALGGQVSQFAIGGGGTLSPLTPATVAATQTAIGVAIAPSGQIANVLSTCVDSTCDGQVAPYKIGANGALTATGSNTLTSGHVNPVAMVADGAGSNAYLLTNFMGVDTNTGAVYQYAIGSTGALVSDTPASLGVSSGSVAQSTYGSHLYVLSANYIGFTSGTQTGGYIDRYDMGTDGRLSAVNTTPVMRGWLTAMTLVVAH
jgi:hypothetical protein